VEFTLPGGRDWNEAKVALPVNGSLLRLYLPAQKAPVELDWVELKPTAGKPQRWEFEAAEKNSLLKPD
jgi:hypothetical protein